MLPQRQFFFFLLLLFGVIDTQRNITPATTPPAFVIYFDVS